MNSCHTGRARSASPVGTRARTPGGIPRGRPASPLSRTLLDRTLLDRTLLDPDLFIAARTPSPGETTVVDVLGAGDRVLPGKACSARGCRAQAQWALLWNNPRLHPPERRKTWLACPAHREHLEAFLGTRGFLRETVPAGEV